MLDITSPSVCLDDAFLLTPAADAHTATPPLELSNGPRMRDPVKGSPFGGYMAAVTAAAAREQLGVTSPLRTLTIQFLAGARFAPVTFRTELLRGGRSTTFAQVRAGQENRPALVALATFGDEGSGPAHRPLGDRLPAADYGSLSSSELDAPFAPHFTRAVEYRFPEPPPEFGTHHEAAVRVWMRTRDGAPLDEARLCFLLDAVFPNYFMNVGVTPATTVDLRYDLFEPLTPDVSPDGWAWFEFTSADVGDGWAVEDGVALAPDGRPLAVARQLRKVLAKYG